MILRKCNPASKVVQIRAALVLVPTPDKRGGLQQEGHLACIVENGEMGTGSDKKGQDKK